MEMEYRRLGKSGLKVSVLSFGSWVTFGPQLKGNLAEDCLAAAYDAGVNFFDNAEAYSAGESERIMGEAIAALGVAAPQLRAVDQALLGDPPGRQHAQHPQPQVPDAGDRRLVGTAGARLRRPALLSPARSGDADRGDGLGTCPTSSRAARPSTGVPRSGRPRQLREAWDIADRHNLHKPVVEQPQYNLLWRDRVEKEYAPPLRRHRAWD